MMQDLHEDLQLYIDLVTAMYLGKINHELSIHVIGIPLKLRLNKNITKDTRDVQYSYETASIYSYVICICRA